MTSFFKKIQNNHLRSTDTIKTISYYKLNSSQVHQTIEFFERRSIFVHTRISIINKHYGVCDFIGLNILSYRIKLKVQTITVLRLHISRYPQIYCRYIAQIVWDCVINRKADLYILTFFFQTLSLHYQKFCSFCLFLYSFTLL